MSERLTDSELADVEQWAANDLHDTDDDRVMSLVREIKARRAADLTKSDAAILMRLKGFILAESEPDLDSPEWVTAAQDLLTKLLAAHRSGT